MDIETLQTEAYADAKAALRACAAAAEQVCAAVARLEEAHRSLRSANRALAEVNRLQGSAGPTAGRREVVLKLVQSNRSH